VAEIQTVEIAKTLGRDASIVIMDEPTSAISDREVESLFAAIRKLKERGVAIVYISHKMDEVFRIADRITVLRDGAYVGTHPAAGLDESKLISLMVGRELSLHRPVTRRAQGDVVLEVRGLGRTGVFRDINFTLRRGEILGFAGLMGAGRTEVMDALFGLAPADSGEILVKARPVRIRRPADAMRHGIGMVTEDRKGCGIVPTLSVAQNTTLASLERCCTGPFIVCKRERATTEENIRQFGIKTAGGRQAISQLSGGNQQKVVIARTLLADPSIVILDEPTRGIDIGAKTEVYAIITRLAGEGKAVILVSSELPEILSLSDRILVLRQGTVTAELVAIQTSQEEILKYAMPE
jgi:inositol transport system ATP-binding protein